MKISRCKLIITSTALGFSGITGIGKKTALASEPSNRISNKNGVTDTVTHATKILEQYFTGAGYVLSPAAPMISGLSFNGGLNYDNHITPSSQAKYVIQSSSRMEDIAKKSKRDASFIYRFRLRASYK